MYWNNASTTKPSIPVKTCYIGVRNAQIGPRDMKARVELVDNILQRIVATQGLIETCRRVEQTYQRTMMQDMAQSLEERKIPTQVGYRYGQP